MENSYRSFKEYLNATLRNKYGVKDEDLRKWMLQQIPDDYC